MMQRPLAIASLLTAAAWALAGCGAGESSYPASVRLGARAEASSRGRLNELIPDLDLTDVDGKTSRLSALLGAKGLLVAIRDTDCPISKKYGPRLARLEGEYSAKGVPFLFLNPTRENTDAGIREEIREFGFRGRYVHDPDAGLAKALAARSSAEVFLLDARRTLVYRGAIDDQYGIGFTREAPERSFLTDALEDYLAHRQVRVPATSAPGCELGLEPAPASSSVPVTYYNQVSRIVQAHCLECHRAGGVGPFALGTYEEVAGRRTMIRRVLKDRFMPPWFAAAGDGPWANDPSLTEEERGTLFHWLDGGTPLGDASDAPLPSEFEEGWDIGTPDLVVELPEPQEIPAEGLVPYRYGAVDIDLPEDRWVQAVQIRPTANANVHHVLVFLESRDRSLLETLRDRLSGETAERRGVETHFAGYGPGSNSAIFPPGTAKRLPAKVRLLFQIHYVTTGTPATDRMRMGIVFSSRTPRYEVETASAFNRDFRIPPGDPNYEVTGTYEFKEAGQILSFGPHMHLRGKAFRYRIVDPDGTSRDVLTIPRYGFNWQVSYELVTPMPVLAGSRLVATGWFDNSADNPANPDPSKTVVFGMQSTDEMMIGYFNWIPSTPVRADGGAP